MAIRIRVYPQNGLGAMGLNGYGGNRMGAVSAQTYYTQKLQSQQQISNLKLQYERALASKTIETVRLEERMKNPYAMLGAGGLGGYPMVATNPYAGSVLGSSMLGGYGGFGGLGGFGGQSMFGNLNLGSFI